jgi:hypothetical protein
MSEDTAVRDLLVAKELGHPFGRRATDPQLRMAVEKGHTGLLRKSPKVWADVGSLADGHEEAFARQVNVHRLLSPFRHFLAARRMRQAAAERTHRIWPLRRSEQADQGQLPACVGATEENWEKSRPVEYRTGFGLAEMYRRAKLVDGFPGEDGTTSDAMVQVCQDLGLVEQAFRYDGTTKDKLALIRWLVDVSSVWWGCGWPESAFRTRLDPATNTETGLIDVTGPCIYGHEVLILGYHKFKRLGPAFQIVNWPQWGVVGRGWILENDFWRWMDEGSGDLLGVLEKRTT